MKRLSEEDILQIHDEQVSLYGGELGIRDENLFKSQCCSIYQTFDDQDLYPDLYDKAVRYLFGFATNQVFLDGNKRTAVMTMLVFLKLNNIVLDMSDDNLYSLSMRVANKQTHAAFVKDYLIWHTVKKTSSQEIGRGLMDAVNAYNHHNDN